MVLGMGENFSPRLEKLRNYKKNIETALASIEDNLKNIRNCEWKGPTSVLFDDYMDKASIMQDNLQKDLDAIDTYLGNIEYNYEHANKNRFI